MPFKPKTHRPVPNVPALVRHQSDRERNQQPYRKLLWTQGFRRFRKYLLAERPTCERCQVEPAKHVHHKRGLAKHLEDLVDQEQCEALCARCHNAATARGE